MTLVVMELVAFTIDSVDGDDPPGLTLMKRTPGVRCMYSITWRLEHLGTIHCIYFTGKVLTSKNLVNLMLKFISIAVQLNFGILYFVKQFACLINMSHPQ